jgi:hypothetical protein
MKSEYEKIGVNLLRPFLSNGKWVFERNGKNYELAPAGIMDIVLSPIVIGVDKLLVIGCKLKKIQNIESGFSVLFSENYFPNVDVKFNFFEEKCNGWVYSVEEVNLKGIMTGQRAWICPYMKIYYPNPPKTIYIKIES